MQSKASTADNLPEEWVDKAAAAIAGVYTFIIFLFSLTALVAIWPSTSSDLSLNSTRTITFSLPEPIFGSQVTLGPETLVVIIMILAGMVGACIFSFYAISLHLAAQNDFKAKWFSWYLLRPPSGGGLALIAYVLIRAGIFTMGSDLKTINFLGVASIAFLVGLFTEHFMVKLHAIADETFGIPPDERSQQAGGQQRSAEAEQGGATGGAAPPQPATPAGHHEGKKATARYPVRAFWLVLAVVFLALGVAIAYYSILSLNIAGEGIAVAMISLTLSFVLSERLERIMADILKELRK